MASFSAEMAMTVAGRSDRKNRSNNNSSRRQRMSSQVQITVLVILAPNVDCVFCIKLRPCKQVDAYREAGKLEAAARLEDQLHLIHGRFQVSFHFCLWPTHRSLQKHLSEVPRHLAGRRLADWPYWRRRSECFIYCLLNNTFLHCYAGIIMLNVYVECHP